MDDIVTHEQTANCGHSAAHKHANHPLDALTADEILAVTAAIRAHPDFGEDVCFETIELKEPPKSDVRAFKSGDGLNRQARAAVFRTGGIGVWRMTVSIDDGRVGDVEHWPDAIEALKLPDPPKPGR